MFVTKVYLLFITSLVFVKIVVRRIENELEIPLELSTVP